MKEQGFAMPIHEDDKFLGIKTEECLLAWESAAGQKNTETQSDFYERCGTRQDDDLPPQMKAAVDFLQEAPHIFANRV